MKKKTRSLQIRHDLNSTGFNFLLTYLITFTFSYGTSQQCVFSFGCREARIRDVCGMWKSDPWPVHTESVSGPGVACSLSQVCRVQSIPGWDLHLFRPGRENLLQKRLCKVGVKGGKKKTIIVIGNQQKVCVFGDKYHIDSPRINDKKNRASSFVMTHKKIHRKTLKKLQFNMN